MSADHPASDCSASPPLLRILCLHGFRQTTANFYGRTSAFRKTLRKVARLEYLEAPFLLEEDPRKLGDEYASRRSEEHGGGGGGGKEDGVAERFVRGRRCWWREESSESDMQTSVDMVVEHLRASATFDGICGFSQGAALVALVFRELSKLGLGGLGLRFAIFFSGYKPSLLCGKETIQVPSLHVWGTADIQVAPNRSEELLSFFESPRSHIHAGGHFIPTSPHERPLYLSFVTKFSLSPLFSSSLAPSPPSACHNPSSSHAMKTTACSPSQLEFSGLLPTLSVDPKPETAPWLDGAQPRSVEDQNEREGQGCQAGSVVSDC